MKLCAVLSALLCAGILSPATNQSAKPSTYRDTKKLLEKLNDVRSDRETLAYLFHIGDLRIPDLVEALGDPNHAISVRAQVVLRYLGSKPGMQAYFDFDSNKPPHRLMSGPVPLPLHDWDFDVGMKGYLADPPKWNSRLRPYIYALVLDNSPRAQATLQEIRKRLPSGTQVPAAPVPPIKCLGTDCGLEELVISHAFFLSDGQKSEAHARFLAFSYHGDKALLEISTGAVPLGEQWFHVVLEKEVSGWRFFSVYLAGAS